MTKFITALPITADHTLGEWAVSTERAQKRKKITEVKRKRGTQRDKAGIEDCQGGGQAQI